jgi:hypothetical protein
MSFKIRSQAAVTGMVWAAIHRVMTKAIIGPIGATMPDGASSMTPKSNIEFQA